MREQWSAGFSSDDGGQSFTGSFTDPALVVPTKWIVRRLNLTVTGLTNNYAMHRFNESRFTFVGGTFGDSRGIGIFGVQGTSWHYTPLNATRLVRLPTLGRWYDRPSQWQTIQKLFDGFHAGCYEAPVRDRGLHFMSENSTRAGCVYDGRVSLVHFRGRYLLYVRLNPVAIGQRFVQLTLSATPCEHGELPEAWLPFRPIRVAGYEPADGNMYFFAVCVNPLRPDSLLALTPLVHDGAACVAVSLSRNGVHWSALQPLVACSTDMERRDAAYLLERWKDKATYRGHRSTSQPAANVLIWEDQVLLFVHEQVPGIGDNATALRRYAVPAQRFAAWTDASLGAHGGDAWPPDAYFEPDANEGPRTATESFRAPPASPPTPSPTDTSSWSRSPPPPPTTETTSGTGDVALTFVVQYWHHPRQLPLICSRLQHPRVEVIVHADSNSSDDREAFAHVKRAYANVRVLQSDNVHEVRGYNRATASAKGHLVAFSQDDRLPPSATGWVDSVLRAFELLPRLGVLGLHRGSTRIFGRSKDLYGTCGDAVDVAGGGAMWNRLLLTLDMTAPLMMVPWLNIGPLVVRRRLFLAIGGFNTSYSKPGQLGIGFDGELTARAWGADAQAALVCPSRATYFRNGCGGKSTTASREKMQIRLRAMAANERLFVEQFRAESRTLLERVKAAQTALAASAPTQRELEHLFPNCSRCSDEADRESGFHDSDHLCASL